MPLLAVLERRGSIIKPGCYLGASGCEMGTKSQFPVATPSCVCVVVCAVRCGGFPSVVHNPWPDAGWSIAGIFVKWIQATVVVFCLRVCSSVEVVFDEGNKSRW